MQRKVYFKCIANVMNECTWLKEATEIIITIVVYDVLNS